MSIVGVDFARSPEFIAGIEAAKTYMHSQGVFRYYIIGGFCRDLLLGRSYKDVDIFVPGPEPVPEGSEELEYDLSQNYVVYQDGIELNVIYMQGAHTIASLINRCDIGICQVGTDAKGEFMFCTEDFVNDMTDNTLTVTRPTRRNHLQRMLQKFPGCTLIDPYEEDHMGDMDPVTVDLF